MSLSGTQCLGMTWVKVTFVDVHCASHGNPVSRIVFSHATAQLQGTAISKNPWFIFGIATVVVLLSQWIVMFWGGLVIKNVSSPLDETSVPGCSSQVVGQFEHCGSWWLAKTSLGT